MVKCGSRGSPGSCHVGQVGHVGYVGHWAYGTSFNAIETTEFHGQEFRATGLFQGCLGQ